MTRQAIIERTVRAINQLPEHKASEISDFADYLSRQFEEETLSKKISELNANSSAFDFLNEEEDLYTTADLKEIYNG